MTASRSDKTLQASLRVVDSPGVSSSSAAIQPAIQPHVSVLMIAYNVEEYIEQALDSVLMQEADFRYEIVIGEDCSTDRTREILTEYARQHEDKIRLILREQNLGMNPNFAATYLECRGRYIALLDGDDYWSSPHKLQKQVDFLEEHPECAICFHNALVVHQDGEQEPHPFHRLGQKYPGVPKPMSGLEEIALGNFMQTCSVMYRGGLVQELPDWYLSMPTFDWPLHVLHAEHGRIGYLDEVLGTYRVHAGGFWSTGMSNYRHIEEVEMMIRAYETINRYLRYRFDKPIRRRLPYLYFRAADASMHSARYHDVRQYALKFLWSSLPRFRWEQKLAFKWLLQALFFQWRQRLAA